MFLTQSKNILIIMSDSFKLPLLNNGLMKVAINKFLSLNIKNNPLLHGHLVLKENQREEEIVHTFLGPAGLGAREGRGLAT